MTTKERLRAELETLSEEDIAALLGVAQRFPRIQTPPAKQAASGLLSRLKTIQIDAPEDFAADLDRYMNGDKQIGGPKDLH